MADKITNDITLLFKTKLDEKSKQEVGKNLKNLLENAAIGFDEAETKRNLEPIIRMMKRLFDKAEIAFDADQLLAMPSRQALQKMAEMEVDQLQMAFDKALAKSGGIKIDFGDMDLSAMTEPLERLTQELSEIGERVVSTTKKSVSEIEKSLKSLDKIHDKAVKKAASVTSVEDTLAEANNNKTISPAKAITTLEHARDAYAKSVKEDNPWVVQYKYLLEFVSKYERLSEKAQMKVAESASELKQLYETLAPKAGDVKVSLEHFVDISKGNELSEYKNQPWARESTLKKIEQTLRNGISVKGSVGYNNDGDSQNPPSPDSDEGDGDKNKKLNTKVPADTGESEEAKAARLAREEEEKARIEAAEKIRREEEKITKTIKERKPYVMFRAVESPESSGKSKEDALSDYGAEVWAQDQESAISYANDQRGVSSLLAARIKPVNPLIFDANDNFWSDFDKIPGLKEFFPNLLGYIKEHDEFDTQKYIHEQAKELGFDSVIFENVRDNLDAETDEDADITTTIAVLDDRIVSLEGAFAQLEELDENGSKVFDSKLSSPPEFYVPPESVDPEQYLQELQDRQAKINGAYENVMSSFNATMDEQRQKLQNAEKELANNPKSSLAKGHVEDAKEEVENTEQIISKFQQQMRYNQRALQIEIDDYARALGKTIDVESEKVDVVSDVQKETDAHQENTAAIVAETQATEGLKEAKSLLPTADGLEAHTYAPSDEQKAYVLKLGEEYRAIMSILEQGDSEFEAALIERAKAIKRIMLETVRGNDGDLVYEYRNVYGGSAKTAASLGDWRQQDNLLHNVDSDKIDDSQRRAAIDLIYQEIEAEKQLEEARRDARAEKQRQELDAFQSKYDSASEEEKQLLYEIIELEKEYRTLYDAGNEESHKAAMYTLEQMREKERSLEKLNSELMDAYDDVGFRRAEPYIKEPAPVIESPVVAQDKSLGDSVEVKDSIDTEELRTLLNSITYNVKVVQDVEPTDDNKVSIDESALEGVLNRVTYNVKLAHDDTDKEANKIAIDEGILESTLKKIVYNVKLAHDDTDKESSKIAIDEQALENTLNKVFANVLNPHEEQTDTEKKNEPWALESTLQSVKSVLDQVQTNTSRIGAVPQTTENDVDSTLAQISKNVSEINTKVVKGTKATTSKQKKEVAKKQAPNTLRPVAYSPERKETAKMSLGKLKMELKASGRLTDELQQKITSLSRSLGSTTTGAGLAKWNEKFKQFKLEVGTDTAQNSALRKQAEELGVWQAKAEKENTQEARNYVSELQKKIKSQQTSLQLTKEERDALAQITEETKQSTLNRLNDKQTDKDAKKQTANAKKLAQREAMLGKAGNAVGRAENTWMSAMGIDGELPAGFTEKIDEYYQQLDALRKKHQELKNSDIISEEQKQELISQTMGVNQLTEEISGLVAEYQRLSGSNVDENKTQATALTNNSPLSNYEAELKQYVNSITKGKGQIKSFNAETKTLTYTVKTGKNEFTEYTAAVRHLDGQLVSVQGTTKRTETFFEATMRKMKEISSYISGMSVLNRIGQELRRGVQYVREIDIALTELKKVTDETEESYDKFLDTAAKTGARLGTTISAVTEATATFAKLGYSMEQATKMAEAAIVYKNVGDNIASTEDAADSIISTMKGFRLEASESMAIVDRFNEVGNRFAITSQGIGEALRLSASALSEGGNSLDESIALITAANEVVNDPSSVGTALKTLTLRLRGSKTELQEMGEDVSDMATTTSQLQAKLLALTGGQVDIMLDENTFKNSTQILREMAEAWEDMTDIQRASALELMGGRLLPLCIEICA